MKMIFSDESRICTSQGDDAETFISGRSNEAYKDDCPKKNKNKKKTQVNFPEALCHRRSPRP